MSLKPKLPSRIANSKLARASYGDELEWLRPSDLKDHDYPRPLILINGCFDLLHTGHMRVIFAARQKAGMRGTVVVAMDSDSRINRSKGGGRPIMTWPERASALSYMPINALVEFDTNEEFKELLDNLQPDLRVQGYDHLSHQSAYPEVPKLFVRAGGMRTTNLIERIFNRFHIPWPTH